jgi:hypothetical protein
VTVEGDGSSVNLNALITFKNFAFAKPYLASTTIADPSN